MNTSSYIRDRNILYSLMFDSWRNGKEQFRNRVYIRFMFDDSVEEAERECLIGTIEQALAAIQAPEVKP